MASSTVLEGIWSADPAVFSYDLFMGSLLSDKIECCLNGFGWPTSLEIPTRSAQLLLLNLGGDASFSHALIPAKGNESRSTSQLHSLANLDDQPDY